MLEPKETVDSSTGGGGGGCTMAALKAGGGTMPRGYATPRGEHKGDLADITSNSAVCTGCPTC
jgi:hypothetical protein